MNINVALVVAYAFSPIYLIPDFIPILGYLDDLIIVPLGVTLALKMIPQPVIAECRDRAEEIRKQGKQKNWMAVYYPSKTCIFDSITGLRKTGNVVKT